MTNFAYRAVDRTGQGKRGEVQAPDRQQALAQVRRLGVTPLSIVETPARADRAHAASGSKARAEMTKALGELGVLANAGLPLDRALALSIENVVHPGVHAEFRRLLGDVRHGVALSRAMAAQPALFPANATAIIEAGEANGRLGAALARVEKMLLQAEEMRRIVVGAMIYPAALLILAVGVILLMLLYVVPQFESLFATARGELPASSVAIMAASRFVRDYGVFLAGGLIALALAARQALARPSLRLARDRLLLTVPQVGPLIRYLEAARLARTLGSLVEGGVPLPDALAMSCRAISNHEISRAIAGVADEVKEGGAVTARIAATGVLPRVAIGFFRTGEETSQLGMMLERLADVLERDVTLRIQRLVAILTPIITIALGGSVAAIIASIMSAILGFNDLAVNQ
jgi:general secretion pathway protein F